MLRIVIAVSLISFVVFEACFSDSTKYEALRVRGSDSEVNLVQSLAEQFMDQDSLVSIGVTGGGSGAGIAALINNQTDLANSSREITEEELYFAKKRDVTPFPIVFAQDALAIIVNKNNPADSVTLQQLSAIYSGNLGNWAEAGGNDQKITLYGRQSSSGTYLYFRDEVVKDEYSRSMIGMSGTAQIVDAIGADASGIGYVSSGYLNESVMKDIKVLSIKKDAQTKAYNPIDKMHIISGDYAITRPLLQYTNGEPTGKLLEFILYQFSEAGQALIEKNGFYPVAKHPFQQVSNPTNE